METTRAIQAYNVAAALYMAMELSNGKWLLLFGAAGSTKRRQVALTAGDRAGVQGQIALFKARFGLPPEAPVFSCYEAGRDGFWIHRWLLSIGVHNRVIDSASIEVTQRAKRVKTDRVDVHKLMNLLVRACQGERDVWHELRVPSRQDEDHRRVHRERERLMKERNALGNRIGSLLATQGLRLELRPGFERQLAQLCCWDGQALPEQLAAEIARMWQRRELLGEQLRGLEQQRCAELADPGNEHSASKRLLMRLRALGVHTPWVLCSEIFGWRQIANRRQLGALAGLTPTPYCSGDSQREQGISGAGNRRVRTAMVELSWLWLRWQPSSALSQWYQRRFGSTGSKRSRRIGIVALARKLLVALWRYLHEGLVPAGAVFKKA
ncbi:IS110 family transposase [Piscinibacter sp.]|uniref:IS110 family transposase n=1 Tax=Piscinibacter sp. TaxID=1903157 RepID=UPI002C907C83|nr:IS110 family transposase [Albitalea sp.]HUG26001.1 IS110 family transposase [Albitalea sp.]